MFIMQSSLQLSFGKTGFINFVSVYYEDHVLVGNYREESLRIPGRPVHFTCRSNCVGFEEIRWYKDAIAIDFNTLMPDNKLKYIKSADNGIVIWNVTTADEGIYTCRSGRFQFAEYGLRLPGIQLSCGLHVWGPWHVPDKVPTKEW